VSLPAADSRAHVYVQMKFKLDSLLSVGMRLCQNYNSQLVDNRAALKVDEAVRVSRVVAGGVTWRC